MIRATGAVVGCLLVVGAAGCRSEAAPLVLDGTPRSADGSGVVADAGLDRLELEDGTVFRYADGFASFSSATQELIAVRGTVGEFVLYGTDGDDLAWLAAVSQVVPVGGERLAYHVGRFLEVEDGRWVFADGTVLPVAGKVDPPATGRPVTVAIDVDQGAVTEVVEG